MFENIVFLLIGAFCIYMGILNRQGNISSLHSYHRKRVSEADRIPFGKLVGLGTIIIGVGAIFNGVFSLLAKFFAVEMLGFIGLSVFITGLAVGLILNFYAMIKYNKGIF